MTLFFYGMAGCIACLALLGAGFLLGWRIRSHVPQAAEPPSQEQERRLREEQQAFHTLQNYSAERAYGIHEGGSL